MLQPCQPFFSSLNMPNVSYLSPFALGSLSQNTTLLTAIFIWWLSVSLCMSDSNITPPKLSVKRHLTSQSVTCHPISFFICTYPYRQLPGSFICLLGSPVGCEFYENRHHFCLVISLFPTSKKGHIGSQF